MCHDPLLAHFQMTVLPSSPLPSVTQVPLSPQQQHHSHRVAMETTERHTLRLRDGERKTDKEGQRERERGRKGGHERLGYNHMPLKHPQPPSPPTAPTHTPTHTPQFNA